MLIFQPDRFLLAEFVREHAPSFRGKVLDVGGGTRRYAGLFGHCEYEILDTDAAAKPDIVASAEAIPLPDSSMDGVVCTQVLGDVWDVQAAMKEMIRVVKPGGLLLLTESLFNEEHDGPHDYWRFTRFAWRKLLEPSCAILRLEPRGGYRTQRVQQAIRYRIEKHNLYRRPILGRVAHLWAIVIGKAAIARDARARDKATGEFPIGYCVLARKNASSPTRA